MLASSLILSAQDEVPVILVRGSRRLAIAFDDGNQEILFDVRDSVTGKKQTFCALPDGAHAAVTNGLMWVFRDAAEVLPETK